MNRQSRCRGERDRTSEPPSPPLRVRRGHRRIAAVLLLALFVSACEIRLRAGNPPDIPALEDELTIGTSTPAEVEAAMGAPYGKGRAMYPFQPEPRDVWSYYYEEGDMEESRRTFVYVFFHEGVYDGYIWFSSLPQTRPASVRHGILAPVLTVWAPPVSAPR